MKKPSLLIIFLSVFIDLIGFGIVLPLLPGYTEDFGAKGFMVGTIMATFSAMQFLFAPAWGRLSDRIGRRPVLLVGLVGSVLFYSLFGYAAGIQPDTHDSALIALALMFVARSGAGMAGATISTAQAV